MLRNKANSEKHMKWTCEIARLNEVHERIRLINELHQSIPVTMVSLKDVTVKKNQVICSECWIPNCTTSIISDQVNKLRNVKNKTLALLKIEQELFRLHRLEDCDDVYCKDCEEYPMCEDCGEEYPCTTIRILKGMDF